MNTYTKDFYSGIKDGSKKSAREIVPILIDLLEPQSVIDIGCGIGTWLSVFEELGVKDILGVDGNYVNRNMLQIPKDKFLAADLSAPFTINRTFDVVMSVEVAEHLPPEYASDFVNSLVKLGPVILFAAAIPNQGGTHHLNEQWPDYWSNLFLQHSYLAVDCLRKAIWTNKKIEMWYRQNILMFIEKSFLAGNAFLDKARKSTNEDQLSIVHPDMFSYYCTPSIKNVLRMIKNLLY